MRKMALMAVGVVILAATAHGQLRVTDLNQGISAEDMVNTLLGGGVTVSNIRYTGATNASGLFCSGTGIIGFGAGVLLTSGSAGNVIGPNNSPNATTDNGLGGDPDLTAIIAGGTSNETFDASVLEFDFVPNSNTVQFSYVFGSEEYNEFVDSQFNDVFAFFVNGTNFALIPATTTPVSINNVNNGYSPGVSTGPCRNCSFYIDNVDGHLSTQLDGLTTVLTFTAPVLAYQVNHMKLAIADAGDRLLDSAVFIQAGSLRSGTSSNATRTARFWFTHVGSTDPTCATLSNAMARIINVNCGVVPLGFLDLPQGYRNNDNVRDYRDALIEGLGFYWRSVNCTGEIGGTQNQKSPASSLCVRRKQLATELIAALANVNYLGTDPTVLTYVNAGTNTAFSSDLVAQAISAAAGDRASDVVRMTALLRKFNNSGRINDLPAGIVECSSNNPKALKKLSRDPTTQDTCPGLNNSCDTAEAVFPQNTNTFARFVFKRTVALWPSYTDDFQSPSCGTGGRDAVWKVKPSLGGGQFTASTGNCNFDTMISVWSGTCDALTEVACTNGVVGVRGETLNFTADGTNTYYVVVEGPLGEYGKLQLKITR